MIGKKGAGGINNASDKRGDNIIVAPNTRVHKSCRANYINQNYIDWHKKTNQLECTPFVVKRSERVSVGPYDSSTDCLYCGNKVVMFEFGVKNDDYGCVKTDFFARHVLMNGHLLSKDVFNIMVEIYTQLTVCIIVLVT